MLRQFSLLREDTRFYHVVRRSGAESWEIFPTNESRTRGNPVENIWDDGGNAVSRGSRCTCLRAREACLANI
jgi:hypothetical protein